MAGLCVLVPIVFAAVFAADWLLTGDLLEGAHQKIKQLWPAWTKLGNKLCSIEKNDTNRKVSQQRGAWSVFVAKLCTVHLRLLGFLGC